MINLRQNKMMAYIDEHEDVTIRELQELFPDVSLMTIHRDLDTLSDEGKIVKFRGGARAMHCSSETLITVREQENLSSKRVMAEKALSLIQPGSSVFLDAGTSNLTLARMLPDINLTVFTSAPNIAMELCHLLRPSINLCCGNLNRANMAVSGNQTIEMLQSINIDLAFIGVSGCSMTDGLSCGMESEMLVKRLVIRKARTSVALCDSSKLTRLMPFTFAKLEDLDYFISDDRLPESFMKYAAESGIKVL